MSLDSYLDNLLNEIKGSSLDTYLDILAKKREREEAEKKQNKAVSLPGYRSYTGRPFDEMVEGIPRGIHNVSAGITRSLAKLVDVTGKRLGELSPDWEASMAAGEFRHREAPSAFDKTASWLNQMSEQIATGGFPEESFAGGVFTGAGQALPDIMALKGLGALGAGRAALPLYGAVMGKEEGGWLGAATGAVHGAMMGEMLHGLGYMPSWARPAMGFGIGAAASAEDPKRMAQEGTIMSLLSIGGPKVTGRQFLAAYEKPLRDFTAREVELVKHIKDTLFPTGAQKLIPEEIAYSDKVRRYGVDSKEFDTRAKQTLPFVLQSHNEYGGATFNLYEGNQLKKDAYAVSIFPDLSLKQPGKTIPYPRAEEWISLNRDVLKDPRLSIGSWYDEKTNTSWLDIVATIKDRDTAIRMGKQANQKEITYLKNLDGIKLGGTGEDPGNLGSLYNRLDRMMLDPAKNHDVVQLYHFTRALNESEEYIDPHAQGRGQIGEERYEIDPTTEMWRLGFLPKSNFYTDKSITLEPHQWVNAEAYATTIPKDNLLVVKKGQRIHGHIDVVTREANKAGWLDENTGQARLIVPTVATKAGHSLTFKGQRASGQDFWSVVQHDPLDVTWQEAFGTPRPQKRFPKIIGWDNANESHFQAVQFMFSRYPKISQLVDKIIFVTEMPEGSKSDVAKYNFRTKTMHVNTRLVGRGSGLHKGLYPAVDTLAHEMIHAVADARMPRKAWEAAWEERQYLKEIGVKYEELPFEKEANLGASKAQKKYEAVAEHQPMTGDAWGRAAEKSKISGNEVEELLEQLRSRGSLGSDFFGLRGKGTPEELGRTPQQPQNFKEDLESRLGSLTKNERNILDLLKSGKLTEDEAKLRSIMQDPEIKSLLKKKPREVMYALESQLIDRFAPARRAVQRFEDISQKSIAFEKNIYNLMRLFPGRFGRLGLAVEELKQIARPVRKHAAEWQEYAIAERAKERWQRDIENPEYAPGKPLGRTEAMKGQAAIAAKVGPDTYKKIQKATTEFYKWSDKWILQTLLDARLISPKLYQDIKAKNQHWFPFEAFKYVDVDQVPNMPVGSELFNVTKQDIVKPMTGASGKIIPPFESIMHTLSKTITLAAKNKVLVNLIQYRSLSPAMKKIIVPIGSRDKVGDPSHYEDIKVVLNGKVTRWLVPKDLGDTLKHMDNKQVDIFGKMVTATSAMFRAGTTSWYLPFTLGNAPRDFKMALLCSRAGFNPVNWLTGLWHGLRSEFGFPTKLFKDYLASGGAFGGLTIPIPKMAVAKLFEPKGIEVAKESAAFIKNIAAAVELAPRLGVFQRASGKGFALQRPWVAGSPMEAGLAARSATIDFSRAGHLMKTVNQYIPFINARLQAKVNIAENLANTNTRAHTIAKAIGWVVIPSLSSYLYNILHHPDTYNEIPAYVKDNYDVVILGTKKDEKGRVVPDYAKLTKGDVEQVFVNPLIAFLEYVRQKDPVKIHEVAINWFSEMSPVPFAREGKLSLSRFLAGGISPLFRAPIEYVQGKSLFTERETVPWKLKRLKASEQYTERTPKVFKALGKATGGSPLKMQAFAKNILGSAFYWPTPEGILSLLGGRVRSTTGGESLNRAYKLQKRAEEGYFTTRKKIEEAIQGRNYRDVYRLQRDWNRDFIDILHSMSRLTGQRLYELMETPFYKMYSFQDKDVRALEKGMTPEKEQESWMSGLEKKLGYKFYSR